jgi:multidrug efflux pump subunit AcrB
MSGIRSRAALLAFNRAFDRLAGRYRGIITWSLNHRRSTLAIAVASCAGAMALFPFVGGSFMPETGQSEFVVQFQTRQGSSLAYTREKASRLEAPLQVEIRGPKTAQLQRLSDAGLRALAGAPGIADLKSSLGDPRPAWRIEVDRDAAPS